MELRRIERVREGRRGGEKYEDEERMTGRRKNLKREGQEEGGEGLR